MLLLFGTSRGYARVASQQQQQGQLQPQQQEPDAAGKGAKWWDLCLFPGASLAR